MVAASFQNGVCDLPKTPKFKGSLGPQYVTDLPNAAAVQFNVDYTYVTHAVATYRAPSKLWELALGGTNITDKRYVVSGQNQGGLAVVDASYNAPRQWYATVRFNFAPGK
jgi:iron complex outermembrane receptor protein